MNNINEIPIVPERRRVVFNVWHLMAARGIRSAAELQRRLIKAGVDISNPQLLRIIDNKSKRVNMDVINGLLNVFQCSVHDLISEKPDPSNRE